MRGIDELERPDAEEGEGWGTIKVNSLPCELGRALGVPLVWCSSCGQRPARRGASDARGQIHIIRSLHRSARALGTQIVDRPSVQSECHCSRWTPRAGRRPWVVVRYTSRGDACLFNIGSHFDLTMSRTRSSLITLLPTCVVAIHLHLSSMFIPDSYIYPTIWHFAHSRIYHFLIPSSIGYVITHTFRLGLICTYIHLVPSCPFIDPSLTLHWPVHLWGLSHLSM